MCWLFCVLPSLFFTSYSRFMLAIQSWIEEWRKRENMCTCELDRRHMKLSLAKCISLGPSDLNIWREANKFISCYSCSSSSFHQPFLLTHFGREFAASWKNFRNIHIKNKK
ncbi:hypothetical protein BpHYR1_002532 [Brachionus plicatilis]|uniref:Secreted protein n=1 Tax=Brachionus plicatilis TaxID=10195 RepID=A0A3M7SQY7_BRAPC|nr:hypothetical protein BpHYR1_002532 [Brachionus plicatilis]